MTRAPSTRIGVCDPLSNTTIARAPAIDRRQSRSISPPPVASSTMTSTSVMIHAVEIRGAAEAAQLDAAAVRQIHADLAVAFRRRKKKHVAANLHHRLDRSRILQPR